jgi:FdhD protein
MPRTPVTSAHVERITRGGREATTDLVAVEEPLQILLEHGPAHARQETPLAMTMRTPGHDRDLVIGFLYAEGVIACGEDLIAVRHCARAQTPENVVRAILREDIVVPSRLLERNLIMTSACGVCGQRSVEALASEGCELIPTDADCYSPRAVKAALRALEASQAWFRRTGGTHGAALFNRSGRLLLHREDVGRHNALDKLFGAWLASEASAARESFIVVSSRASFELVQKTLRAGVPMLVSIGAPSSLAIETARRFGVTLVGFASENRLNVYAGAMRIARELEEPVFFDIGTAE